MDNEIEETSRAYQNGCDKGLDTAVSMLRGAIEGAIVPVNQTTGSYCERAYDKGFDQGLASALDMLHEAIEDLPNTTGSIEWKDITIYPQSDDGPVLPSVYETRLGGLAVLVNKGHSDFDEAEWSMLVCPSIAWLDGRHSLGAVDIEAAKEEAIRRVRVSIEMMAEAWL